MKGKNSDGGCSLLRHTAIVIYDGILLFAVLFFATALVLIFHDGAAIESGNPLFFLYLLGCSYLYFAWQWVHGGQTLGMRAWHIKVTARGDSPLTWRTAGLRFVSSLLSWLLLGAGFLWRLFDRDGRTLHDRLSDTYLLVIKSG